MSGNNYLLDTNIILYLLDGDKILADILNTRKPYVSYITEMELLGSPQIISTELKKIQSFLSACYIIEMNQQIKQPRYKYEEKPV